MSKVSLVLTLESGEVLKFRPTSSFVSRPSSFNDMDAEGMEMEEGSLVVVRARSLTNKKTGEAVPIEDCKGAFDIEHVIATDDDDNEYQVALTDPMKRKRRKVTVNGQRMVGAWVRKAFVLDSEGQLLVSSITTVMDNATPYVPETLAEPEEEPADPEMDIELVDPSDPELSEADHAEIFGNTEASVD